MCPRCFGLVLGVTQLRACTFRLTAFAKAPGGQRKPQELIGCRRHSVSPRHAAALRQRRRGASLRSTFAFSGLLSLEPWTVTNAEGLVWMF